MYFNSSMVQLKLSFVAANVANTIAFQFLNGSIKADGEYRIDHVSPLFQFLNGSIKA